MPIGWTWLFAKGTPVEGRVIQKDPPDYSDGSYKKAIKEGYISEPEQIYTEVEVKELRDKIEHLKSCENCTGNPPSICDGCNNYSNWKHGKEASKDGE